MRVGRRVLAGLIGTSVMTAAQELRPDHSSSAHEQPSWDTAPAPAQVGRKALEALGVDPPPSWIPMLTQTLHWAHGTTFGVLYTARGRPRHPVAEGLLYGLIVWGASYVQLVPLGIYKPPWKYSLRSLGPDIAYHVAYGIGVASATKALS